jgi:hypothetical protein
MRTPHGHGGITIRRFRLLGGRFWTPTRPRRRTHELTRSSACTFCRRSTCGAAGGCVVGSGSPEAFTPSTPHDCRFVVSTSAHMLGDDALQPARPPSPTSCGKQPVRATRAAIDLLSTYLSQLASTVMPRLSSQNGIQELKCTPLAHPPTTVRGRDDEDAAPGRPRRVRNHNSARAVGLQQQVDSRPARDPTV